MAAIGAACLVVCVGQAASLNEMLLRGFKLEHGAIPFYSQPERKLCAVVRIDKAYLDYEQRGFFHIGILPMGTVEGVTFELEESQTAASALEQLDRWLGGQSGSRLELRHVKFTYLTNSLQAGRIKCRGSQWDLLEGVEAICRGRTNRTGRATLQVAGKQAGQLVMEGVPPCTNSLLGLTFQPGK